MDWRSERGACEFHVDDAVAVQSVSHLKACRSCWEPVATGLLNVQMSLKMSVMTSAAVAKNLYGCMQARLRIRKAGFLRR